MSNRLSTITAITAGMQIAHDERLRQMTPQPKPWVKKVPKGHSVYRFSHPKVEGYIEIAAMNEKKARQKFEKMKRKLNEI